MRCPICGGAELAPDTQDMPYRYKGELTLIQGVSGDYCSACGEAVLSHDEAMRVSEQMSAFERRVNTALVDPAFISAVRKKFDLDQREAGEIFGGGVNAFSRYENGKTTPPVALIKLFKLLDRHPELFEEVRTA
ncbi:type II toxin-antitoxin system MqsA family antitoxin [Pseudomonas sichuanensis]|uniref:type II toxin-antitoxin system MqsA family antitoxin n=1 Tax=Pseudomonas TaxID=286 RepID=UPI0024479E98|nr:MULTISPECIES: type II toxin-antitoxin system MqsA family antitoxin [Pseudomonas]MDH0731737.1 type II toxin-antitoxin system MqsA family antitoxin [Pseudomonas sichuanensis]MDH1581574.1 type II toxin-antitoxin system MqsA family antitoxin [Pseudomonas sichuanensis]MDH1594652.1 type II toxin-antitoxin system MqsA family antitoxin [Pseudomonas sichuanensis]MDH1599223.1 type II toxin-antitoxin system MqsA family antitoxin [Pseudomonas sichuanensis]MDU9405089.1 type II toxin-antitoxin system Mqs